MWQYLTRRWQYRPYHGPILNWRYCLRDPTFWSIMALLSKRLVWSNAELPQRTSAGRVLLATVYLSTTTTTNIDDANYPPSTINILAIRHNCTAPSMDRAHFSSHHFAIRNHNAWPNAAGQFQEHTRDAILLPYFLLYFTSVSYVLIARDGVEDRSVSSLQFLEVPFLRACWRQ